MLYWVCDEQALAQRPASNGPSVKTLEPIKVSPPAQSNGALMAAVPRCSGPV